MFGEDRCAENEKFSFGIDFNTYIVVVVIMHAEIDKEIPYRLLSSLYCSTIGQFFMAS